MKTLYRFFVERPNRWFDDLSEPRRFLTVFLPFAAACVIFSLWRFVTPGAKETLHIYTLQGSIFLSILLWRAAYLYLPKPTL